MNKWIIKYTGKNFESWQDLQKFLIEIVEDKKFSENLKNFSENNERLEKYLDKNDILKISENLVENLKKLIWEDFFWEILNNRIDYDWELLDLKNLFTNKKIKKVINNSYEWFWISENKISLLITFFKEKIINTWTQTFIESDNCELSHFKKCFYYLDDYFWEFFNQKEKIYLAKKFSKLDEKIFFEYLDFIEKINFQNSVKNFEKDQKKNSERIQKNLILFLSKQNFLENKKNLEDLKNFLNIFNEIISDENFQIYLSKLDNDQVLFERIFQCVQDDKIILKTITCPDYSWKILEEDWKKSFEYDFETINTWCWIVAEKGFDFVKNMSKIFEKYISDVQIEHFLPTFEFYQSEKENWFKWKNIEYFYEDCVEKLWKSCKNIWDKYSQNNLNAKVDITNNWVISDKILREKQEIEKQKIISELENSNKNNEKSEIYKFISEIYKKRVKLYLNWYPKQDWESDKEHHNRISEIIVWQLAEYLVFSKEMLKDKNSFALMSDSIIMQDIYTFWKLPVLYWVWKNVLDYAWAN